MTHKFLLKINVCFLFFICGSLLQGQEKKALDISAYYKLVDGDRIYPSPEQIQMLTNVVPNQVFQPAPAITDRAYWNAIANSVSGKEYLEKALSELNKKPEVPISDSVYRRANKEGNRKIYKPRYYRTMKRLEHYILAECIQNEGRFLPQITIYLNSILAMKSWLHPNHDPDNKVLEGKRMSIDLGARRFASDLALAEVLLKDKLPIKLRNEIKLKLNKRIIDSYLKSSKTSDTNNRWINGTSNWNAVCTSGSVFTVIAISEDNDQRIAAVGSALNSMRYYLSGFGADGYCSEGVGYWRYGFGHYLYLAQILYDYTNEKINLFEANNPDKLNKIANFPENFHIQNDKYAPFSDGSSVIKNNEGNFAYLLAAKQYGARKPTEIILDQAVEQLVSWNNSEGFETRESSLSKTFHTPDYSIFKDFGMVISRGKQKNPFSIAVKAGHNAENHNHSDVGTYSILLGDNFISGDIGAPSYIAGAFSPDNKARSSWGHPVPEIDHTLQSNGRAFFGTITTTEFKDKYDKVVMDLKGAYKLATLNSLTRTIINDKSGDGTITIEDHFIASKPISFATTIMTFSNYEIIEENSLILKGKTEKVKVEIESKNGKFVIKPELVPVKHLREGKGREATRISIDFEKSTNEGTIIIKYIPVK